MRAYPLVLMRIAFPKSYHARVSYLPLPKDPETGKPVAVSPKESQLKLPGFSEPVPDDWVTIDDNFYIIYAINVSMLDPEAMLAPDALVDDGILHLGPTHLSFLGF